MMKSSLQISSCLCCFVRLSWLPVILTDFWAPVKFVVFSVHCCNKKNQPIECWLLQRRSLDSVQYRRKKLSCCWDSWRYDKITDSDRSDNLIRNPEYNLRKFCFTKYCQNLEYCTQLNCFKSKADYCMVDVRRLGGGFSSLSTV